MENTQSQINGCIIALNYQSDSQDCGTLRQIWLDSFDSYLFVLTNKNIPDSMQISSVPSQQELKLVSILNLNDFQKIFQEAANLGHGVTLTIESEKITSLSIFPQRCAYPEKKLVAYRWPPNTPFP